MGGPDRARRPVVARARPIRKPGAPAVLAVALAAVDGGRRSARRARERRVPRLAEHPDAQLAAERDLAGHQLRRGRVARRRPHLALVVRAGHEQLRLPLPVQRRAPEPPVRARQPERGLLRRRDLRLVDRHRHDRRARRHRLLPRPERRQPGAGAGVRLPHASTYMVLQSTDAGATFTSKLYTSDGEGDDDRHRDRAVGSEDDLRDADRGDDQRAACSGTRTTAAPPGHSPI